MIPIDEDAFLGKVLHRKKIRQELLTIDYQQVEQLRRKGKNQVEVARILGMDSRTLGKYYRWKRGKDNLPNKLDIQALVHGGHRQYEICYLLHISPCTMVRYNLWDPEFYREQWQARLNHKPIIPNPTESRNGTRLNNEARRNNGNGNGHKKRSLETRNA